MSDYRPGSSDTPSTPYAQNGLPPGYQQQAPYPAQPATYTMPQHAPMQPQSPMASPYAAPYTEQKSKVAAALLAFFLGGFGIHGFYLGNTGMGIALLLINLVSLPLMLIGIGFLGWFGVGIICLIQTILYISVPDQQFYQKYVVEKRWF